MLFELGFWFEFLLLSLPSASSLPASTDFFQPKVLLCFFFWKGTSLFLPSAAFLNIFYEICLRQVRSLIPSAACFLKVAISLYKILLSSFLRQSPQTYHCVFNKFIKRVELLPHQPLFIKIARNDFPAVLLCNFDQFVVVIVVIVVIHDLVLYIAEIRCCICYIKAQILSRYQVLFTRDGSYQIENRLDWRRQGEEKCAFSWVLVLDGRNQNNDLYQ
jgi:hypothetical protein